MRNKGIKDRHIGKFLPEQFYPTPEKNCIRKNFPRKNYPGKNCSGKKFSWKN
jgi:hypothetical protein